MRVTGLFAGIGGLELGLSQNGHAADLLCEIWEPARAVLADRFPNTPLHDDVATLAGLPGSTTLLAAGFPCQDLSQAGGVAGIDGGKSGLVSHVFRLLDVSRPELLLLENVPFMLQLAGGRAMRVIVDALEERGYRWAYRVVTSLCFVPQRRERVFLLASRGDLDPREVLFADDSPPKRVDATLATHAHGFYWTEGVRGLGWAVDAIPTLKNGSTIGIPSPPAIMLPNGVPVKPDLRDAERLQGFPADWTSAAEAAGRSSLRWSLVGNAVTVPVAAWLGRRLSEPGSHDGGRETPIAAAQRWPKAACGVRGRRFSVEIGACPDDVRREPLATFLRYRGAPLSARATRGFLDRTAKGSLRFVPGFLEKLRAHLAAMEDLEGRPLFVQPERCAKRVA